MPCKDPEHSHEWPDEGELIIQKCERYCAYCKGEAKEHEWKFPWFLRRHVRTVHKRPDDHPNVFVSEEWGSAQAVTTPSSAGGGTPKKRSSPVKHKAAPKKKSKAIKNAAPARKRRTKKQKTPESSDSESDVPIDDAESADGNENNHPLPSDAATPDGKDSSNGSSEVVDLAQHAGASETDDSHDNARIPDIRTPSENQGAPETPRTYEYIKEMRRDLSTLGIGQAYPGSAVSINPALLLINPSLSPASALTSSISRNPSSAGSRIGSPDAFSVTDTSRTPQTPNETPEAARARHQAVLASKSAYREALQHLAAQGAATGLTPVELGLITADEVDRLMLLGHAWIAPGATPYKSPSSGNPQRNMHAHGCYYQTPTRGGSEHVYTMLNPVGTSKT